MTRIELATAFAVAVVLAAALGWGLHALWIRLAHGHGKEAARLADLSARLAGAEDELDAALAHARGSEERLSEELAQTAAHLSGQLAQRDAELEAAMDAVGALRRDVARWREAAARDDES